MQLHHANYAQRMAKEIEKETDPAIFLIDNAFLAACKNCAVQPRELQGKTLESFKEEGLPEDVAVRRFNNYQFSRVRKLHMVVMERKKLLSDDERITTYTARPPAQRSSTTTPQAQTPRGTKSKEDDDKDQRGLMIRRAKHQREVWDTLHHRHDQQRQRLEERADETLKNSLKFGDEERQRREREEHQKMQLQRLNQQQMKKRWERDDELAAKRQERIDHEYQKRMENYKLEMESVSEARKRRNAQLRELQAEGKHFDDTVAAKLHKAKQRYTKQDEDKRGSAQKQIDHAQARREENVFQKFLHQAKLANRSLEERRHTQEVLDKAAEREEQRIQRALKEREEAEEKAKRIQQTNESSAEQRTRSLAARRDENHLHALSVRQESDKRQEQRRLEEDAARQKEEKQRRNKAKLEKMLKDEDLTAREEHRQELLKRVAKRTANAQTQKMQEQEERQKDAESRLKKLEEIRSLLQ